MKTIWHVGGWGGNVGDRVLQVSTSRLLEKSLGQDLKFIHVNCQQTCFSKSLIDKMNKEADLLLLGGGGMIMHRPQDNSKSGWQFNIATQDIKQIKIPIVVYGIGYNQFPFDDFKFSSNMWDNLQCVIDQSLLFSVRNRGTLDTIKSNGIDITNINVVPDAAVFSEADLFEHSIFNTEKIKIGLNWATDRWNTRFGSVENGVNILKETLFALKHMVKLYNAQVYLIEHLTPNELCSDSKIILHNLVKEILGDSVHILYDEIRSDLYPPSYCNAGFFVDIYRKMDITMGFRGHANIISFAQNVPCIGLGKHNKVKWFLDEIDMRKWLVPLDYGHISDLHNVFDDILKNHDMYKNMLKSKYVEFENVKNHFLQKIHNIME